MDGAEAEQDGGDDDGHSAQHNLGDGAAAGAFKLAEKNAAPQQADQRVGVPEREGDGQADVANGEDSERVGDGPQHSGEDGVENQMAVDGQIGEDVAGAFEQGGQRPAGGEDAGDHAERDGEGRKAGVDQFGGRLGRAQPHAGGESAGHADAVDGAEAGAGLACIGLAVFKWVRPPVARAATRSVQGDEQRQADHEDGQGNEEVAVGEDGASF